MKLQISSGQGPVECELAVGKLADALCLEFNACIVQANQGIRDGCYRSVVIECESDLGFLEGTVKWVCQSPFRPNHRRKNWFIDVSPVREFEGVALDDGKVRFDTF